MSTLALCFVCGINPLPSNCGPVRWCDSCLDECLASGEKPPDFIMRKRQEA